MSAAIIQFIRGPKRNRGRSDLPAIAFRSAALPDDLVMDHLDTAPDEYAGPGSPDEQSEIREPNRK